MAGYTARLSWRFNGTDPKHKRINSHALTALAASGKEIFKFVATTPNGIDEIAHRQNHFKLDPIWVCRPASQPSPSSPGQHGPPTTQYEETGTSQPGRTYCSGETNAAVDV
ncbi:MAG: hypothetical protein ACRDUV_16875 [Pseudonocardiaceae bacterium]